MTGLHPATPMTVPSLASARTPLWSGEIRGRESAVLGFSLGGLVWLLPPLHWLVFGATVMAVYGIGRSRYSRNQKLVMVLPILALFIAAKQEFPRPGIAHMLWSGVGLEAFFVLRSIDWAIGKPPKGLSDTFRDRIGRYLLFLFFFPTLFAGPVATYRDFYRSYVPWQTPLPQLKAHVAKILWGGLKFYLVQGYVRGAAMRTRALADAGESLFGVFDPWVLLWVYVFLYLIHLYVAFSGFCDIAIGAARILGFQLYENFDNPLLSQSPIRYWQTMHISAYRWLMTHVFYPYWRHDRITLKVLTVFLASALWHIAVAKNISVDVVVQVFIALTLYGLSVALLFSLSRTVLGQLLTRARTGRYGYLVLLSQIGFTFVFIALIHQIFWAGMTGRPLKANVQLFRQLFLGFSGGPS